jgi:hypothetical protein
MLTYYLLNNCNPVTLVVNALIIIMLIYLSIDKYLSIDIKIDQELPLYMKLGIV